MGSTLESFASRALLMLLLLLPGRCLPLLVVTGWTCLHCAANVLAPRHQDQWVWEEPSEVFVLENEYISRHGSPTRNGLGHRRGFEQLLLHLDEHFIRLDIGVFSAWTSVGIAIVTKPCVHYFLRLRPEKEEMCHCS